jgi:hypothetical protein
MSKLRLYAGEPDLIIEAIRKAADLGVKDELNGARHKTGQQMCELLCGSWAVGHRRILLGAYKGARWHTKMWLENCT